MNEAGAAATEIDRLRADLADARSRIAELEDFAGLLAHNVQGPARSVAALAELLRADHDGPADANLESLDLIVGQSRQLAGLAAALLTYTRMATKDVRLSTIELEPIVEQVVDEVSPLAAEVGAKITLTRPFLPIPGNATLLSVALLQLTTNALEHGRPTEVSIACTEQSGAANNLGVVLSVTDDGEGLEADRVPEAFRPLRRLRPGATGHGLGLAVVRRAALRMNGSAGLEPGPEGRGMIATIRLPGRPGQR